MRKLEGFTRGTCLLVDGEYIAAGGGTFMELEISIFVLASLS